MASDEDDIRRILRDANKLLWASDITERLNAMIGTGAFTVDRAAARLIAMEDVECLRDGPATEVVAPA